MAFSEHHMSRDGTIHSELGPHPFLSWGSLFSHDSSFCQADKKTVQLGRGRISIYKEGGMEEGTGNTKDVWKSQSDSYFSKITHYTSKYILFYYILNKLH